MALAATRELTTEQARCFQDITRWFGNRPPRKVYVIGPLEILDLPRVGVLASQEVDPVCVLKAYELLDLLASMPVCVIGGWHSALEQDMVRRLSRGIAKLAAMPAKGLAHYAPPALLMARLTAGDALALTHCGDRVSRMTRGAAMRRNRLLAALSNALFVPYASRGSATAKLVAEAAANGVPVATVDRPNNQHLVLAGATPCDRPAFTQWIEAVVRQSRPAQPLSLA